MLQMHNKKVKGKMLMYPQSETNLLLNPL